MRDHYKNMIPRNLAYYKPIAMPRNKDYLVGMYSKLTNKQNQHILTDLFFSDFDTLSGENWLNNFVIDICLLTYASNLGLKNTYIMASITVIQLMQREKHTDGYNQKITLDENSMVIKPWLLLYHWIIAIINFKTKVLYHEPI